MGRLCFLSSGRTEADLKEWGKVPSERARLMMLVLGSRRESRHDLSRKVGIISRVQEALEDLRMAILTSSVLAGEKDDRQGGTIGGVVWGETLGLEVKTEQSLMIFWSKKLRKEVARTEWDNALGRTAGALQDNREFIVDQSLLGWLEQREIRLR